MGEHLNFFLYITRAPTSHLIWATRASYVRGVFLRHKLFLSRQIWYTVAAKQILQRMTYKLFPFIIQIHSIILSQSIFGFGIKHVAIVFLKTLRQKLQWKKKKKVSNGLLSALTEPAQSVPFKSPTAHPVFSYKSIHKNQP